MTRSLRGLMQEALETVYRVEGPEPVEPFCVSEEIASCVARQSGSRVIREALFVEDTGDEAWIGLFVSPRLLKEAEDFLRPGRNAGRHTQGVDAFCAVVEGVSHFLYLTFSCARQERPVSQMELELQAEVDKFLIVRLFRPIPGAVARLFDNFRLDRRLTHDERARYRVANHHARRYARWFDRQFARGDGHAALEDARRLYRKPLTEKLEHIARAA